jgi:CRP-like cAMP-binding protein
MYENNQGWLSLGYMFESLFQYIAAHSSLPLSEADKELIEATLKLKKLRRKQYFLQEGDIGKHIGFVLKGALRSFSIDDKGHEHIVRFALEKWWIGDYESFVMQTPATFHVEATEDTELLLMSYQEQQALREAIPAYGEMMTILEKRGIIAMHRRIHSAIRLTAEERYKELMETYPEFIQRFPRNMIASYLGITPETLSRVRKQALHK